MLLNWRTSFTANLTAGTAPQRILNRMRGESFAGHYVLVQEHRGAAYRLARMGATPADPISYTGDTFPTLKDAEWAVFKLRWRNLFTTDLSTE